MDMILYIPFIWFLVLTIVLICRNGGVEVSAFLSAQFAFTSLCAIICVNMGYLEGGGIHYTAHTLQLGILPTLLYCILHTILILPFARLNSLQLSDIPIVHLRIFNYFAYFLMAVALLNIYVVMENVVQVLVGGDFATVRSAHYAGEDTLAMQRVKSLPRILGYFYYFNRTTILALPCFFYSLCFLNKKWYFNLALFISALSLPLVGIMNVDRTEFLFFIQTCCVCLLLFRLFIKQRQRTFLKKILVPCAVLMFGYFAMVTIARFGDREGGAEGGFFQYAGQGYLNFCFFFDNCNSSCLHMERMFPFFSKITQGDINYVNLRDQISQEQGFFISVFPTYLGDFLCDTGMVGMLIWVIGFLVLLLLTLPKQTSQPYFGQIFWYYMMATIPMFGIFYYPYFSWLQVVCIIICAIMSMMFHYTFKVRP